MSLQERFNLHFEQSFGQTKGRKLLCAVSGGPDSMVMLNLLLNINQTIAVAHCNYKLRAAESDADEKLVTDFCRQHSIPLFTTSFDTLHLAELNKTGIQETARILRYDWFNQLLSTHQYDLIVTAHHADDNAETILFNLIRGTGMTGTSGIPVISNNTIRPLLNVSKKDILNYAAQQGIPYRLDESNEGTKYSRNKIRNAIFPILKGLNPRAIEHINAFGLHSKIATELIQGKTQQLAALYLQHSTNTISLNCKELLKLPNCSFWLYELLKPFDCNQSIVNDIIDCLTSKRTGANFITPSHRLVINRGDLLISPSSQYTESILLPIQLSDLPFSIQNHSQTIQIELLPSLAIPILDGRLQYLDLDAAGESFTLRNWTAGDKFHPLGMDKQKKISDYFSDKKVNPYDKKNALVLENSHEIIAVIGHQISNNVKVTATSKRILCITIKQ